MSSFEEKINDKEFMLKVMKTMLTSRHFELKVNEMFMLGLIHGTTHLGVGQEASHAGISLGLEARDWIVPTHRGHGHCLAKGATPYNMFCELFANYEGGCKGLGGSMHYLDLDNHNLGSSAIVGAGIPTAVGCAYALKRQGKDEIVCGFFGDGASSQGMVLEGMNLASVWEAPVLLLCENNHFGMSTPAKFTVSVEDIADRGPAFNIKSKKIDGMDVLEVLKAVMEAREYIAETGKPYLLELKTYRYLGHSKSDQRKYRTKEEEEDVKKNQDSIMRFSKYLIEKGFLTQEEFDKMDKDTEAEIEKAAEDARKVDKIISVEEAMTYVYAD